MENDINICEDCQAFEKCKGYLFGVKCENNALFIPKRNKKIQDRIKKIPEDVSIMVDNHFYLIELEHEIDNLLLNKTSESMVKYLINKRYHINEHTKHHDYNYVYNSFISFITHIINNFQLK